MALSSNRPMSCRCGCGRRVALKGMHIYMLTKPCSRRGFSFIDLKKLKMTKAQLRRLAGPDDRQEKYQTSPKEMKLTDLLDLPVIRRRRQSNPGPTQNQSTRSFFFFHRKRRLNSKQSDEESYEGARSYKIILLVPA